MQREEKQLDLSIEAIVTRLSELKNQLHSLLYKIEFEADALTWPTVLDNFALISAQYTAISKMLNTEKTPSLRNYTVLPLRLSQDRDEELTRLTEGRIPTFCHDLVPDYLRTKLEPDIEKKINQLVNKANSVPLETAQKQSTAFNKVLNHVLDTINKSRAEWESEAISRGRIGQTSSMNDTHIIMSVITMGKGLKQITPQGVPSTGPPCSNLMVPPGIRPNVPGPNPGPLGAQNNSMNPNQSMQMSMIAKAPPVLKTNVKSASQLQYQSTMEPSLPDKNLERLRNFSIRLERLNEEDIDAIRSKYKRKYIKNSNEAKKKESMPSTSKKKSKSAKSNPRVQNSQRPSVLKKDVKKSSKNETSKNRKKPTKSSSTDHLAAPLAQTRNYFSSPSKPSLPNKSISEWFPKILITNLKSVSTETTKSKRKQYSSSRGRSKSSTCRRNSNSWNDDCKSYSTSEESEQEEMLVPEKIWIKPSARPMSPTSSKSSMPYSARVKCNVRQPVVLVEKIRTDNEFSSSYSSVNQQSAQSKRPNKSCCFLRQDNEVPTATTPMINVNLADYSESKMKTVTLNVGLHGSEMQFTRKGVEPECKTVENFGKLHANDTNPMLLEPFLSNEAASANDASSHTSKSNQASSSSTSYNVSPTGNEQTPPPAESSSILSAADNVHIPQRTASPNEATSVLIPAHNGVHNRQHAASPSQALPVLSSVNNAQVPQHGEPNSEAFSVLSSANNVSPRARHRSETSSVLSPIIFEEETAAGSQQNVTRTSDILSPVIFGSSDTCVNVDKESDRRSSSYSVEHIRDGANDKSTDTFNTSSAFVLELSEDGSSNDTILNRSYECDVQHSAFSDSLHLQLSDDLSEQRASNVPPRTNRGWSECENSDEEMAGKLGANESPREKNGRSIPSECPTVPNSPVRNTDVAQKPSSILSQLEEHRVELLEREFSQKSAENIVAKSALEPLTANKIDRSERNCNEAPKQLHRPNGFSPKPVLVKSVTCQCSAKNGFKLSDRFGQPSSEPAVISCTGNTVINLLNVIEPSSGPRCISSSGMQPVPEANRRQTLRMPVVDDIIDLTEADNEADDSGTSGKAAKNVASAKIRLKTPSELGCTIAFTDDVERLFQYELPRLRCDLEKLDLLKRKHFNIFRIVLDKYYLGQAVSDTLFELYRTRSVPCGSNLLKNSTFELGSKLAKHPPTVLPSTTTASTLFVGLPTSNCTYDSVFITNPQNNKQIRVSKIDSNTIELLH